MEIQQIHVEAFGTLSQCRMSPLSNELTILYGSNGSGKTTLLEFVRGILCGFDHGRRLRLLPPLAEGAPGGRLSVRTTEGEFQFTRLSRGEANDTFAISQRQGSASSVAALRDSVEGLSESLIRTLFMVSGYEAADLNGLVRIARKLNIELVPTRRSASWLEVPRRQLRDERTRLWEAAASKGELAQLQQRRNRLEQEIEEARRVQQQQIATWDQALRRLQLRLQALQAEACWLGSELQATETDLTEVQTRLWSHEEITIEEEHVIETQEVPAPAEWMTQIAEIDQEIANAQQVLRDLAGSRHNLSVTKAGLAGSDAPDLEVTFERQRQSLAAMEQQTVQLLEMTERLKTASDCLCGAESGNLEQTATELRSQIWLMCQELSRQQTAHQQWLLQLQREGVDGCEAELIRQIRRLRLRREDVLQKHLPKASDRVAFRTLHESEECRCHGHAAAAADCQIHSPVVTVPQTVKQTRTSVISLARPGDYDAEHRLKHHRRQLWEQHQEALNRIWHGEQERTHLLQAGPGIGNDRRVQNLRNELELVDQQMSDCRERWQTLQLAEVVLEKTQRELHVEIPAPLIDEASALLSKMTSGRYIGFRYDPEQRELLVITKAETELPAIALSRGTLEQAALCFRLSLCRACHRLGYRLPLLLDDVLVDSDEHRSRAAVEVLIDCARSQQIIFLTCQEHLLELFRQFQVPVLDLPGSVRPSQQKQVTLPVESAQQILSPLSESPASTLGATIEPVSAASSVKATLSPAPQPVQESVTVQEELSTDEEEEDFTRVQPDQPYWLTPHSPLGEVPSLGAQMARRLSTVGIRDVGDLVDLDISVLEIPLDSLQITVSTLRQWQAEARLLCCVPNLTGRDAQALVLSGIHSPDALSQMNANELQARLAQLQQNESYQLTLPWLSERSDWPTSSASAKWIRFARQARPWKQVRDQYPSTMHSAARSALHSRIDHGSEAVIPAPHIRLHQRLAQTLEERGLKFFLNIDSPIVDAPSIGPRTAERLNAIGIHRVSQLLEMSAKEIAMNLGRREVSTDTVTAWQQQASLMCRVPQLRGHDVQVLVSCQITEPEKLAAMTPRELFSKVGPFARSKEGQRLLRSAKTPDLEEVTEWIECARIVQHQRAA